MDVYSTDPIYIFELSPKPYNKANTSENSTLNPQTNTEPFIGDCVETISENKELLQGIIMKLCRILLEIGGYSK